MAADVVRGPQKIKVGPSTIGPIRKRGPVSVNTTFVCFRGGKSSTGVLAGAGVQGGRWSEGLLWSRATTVMEDCGGRRDLVPSTKSIRRFTVSCFFVFLTQLSLALVPRFLSTSSLLSQLSLSGLSSFFSLC